MKKFSIAEKAKAYDEALKVLHKYDSANIMFSQSLKEEMFPELKESGDERIRKEIISYIKNSTCQIGEETYNSWIAWLEKQGEHKKFRDSIQVGDKVTRNQDGMLVNLSQLKRIAKPNETKQGEKFSDKVEPKFKVGDWIIKNDDSPINIDYICCKITKVENGNYTIESIYGYKGYNTFETFEKDYHLWTIPFDAVLVYNPSCSNECRNHLITLYNELKKLREE